MQATIKANLDPLESFFDFPYLGWTIPYKHSDWVTLNQNLRKVQRNGVMVPGVLVKAGSTVWERLIICKSVVQEVLLNESESWFITDMVMKVLEGFQQRIAL